MFAAIIYFIYSFHCFFNFKTFILPYFLRDSSKLLPGYSSAFTKWIIQLLSSVPNSPSSSIPSCSFSGITWSQGYPEVSFCYNRTYPCDDCNFGKYYLRCVSGGVMETEEAQVTSRLIIHSGWMSVEKLNPFFRFHNENMQWFWSWTNLIN